jgi:hypothetical protein
MRRASKDTPHLAATVSFFFPSDQGHNLRSRRSSDRGGALLFLRLTGCGSGEAVVRCPGRRAGGDGDAGAGNDGGPVRSPSRQTGVAKHPAQP